MEILKIMQEASEKLAKHTDGLAFNLADLENSAGQEAAHVRVLLEAAGEKDARSRDLLHAMIRETRTAIDETFSLLLGRIDGEFVARENERQALAGELVETLNRHGAAIVKLRQSVVDQTSPMPATGKLTVYSSKSLVNAVEGELAENITPEKAAA